LNPETHGTAPPRLLPVNWREQKKGRPIGRPCIALDCCAPNVHPYTVETSLQLALPAPYKYVGTSLLASLLKINICHPLGWVKHILIISLIFDNLYLLFNIFNDLSNTVIFNILKNNSANGQLLAGIGAKLWREAHG